jgi:predicted dehydrogenase
MIKVGIAGVGFMGMIHYLAYQKVRGAKVVALCEKDRLERLDGDWRSIKGNFGPQGTMMDLKGIAKYTDLEKMFADGNVDMVDICLPPCLHAKAAVAALKAGKHVVCEKPIALKVADAEAMVKAAQKARKMLMIAHVLPFFPAYRFAYKTITGGKYGRLLGGDFRRVISDPLWLRDFYDPNGCGGPMVDLHIHDAHFIRLICGMPRTVQSVGRMRGEVAEFFSTQFLCDDPSLVITATSGVINQQGRPFTNGYEIHLERATLVFDSGMGMPVTVFTADGRVTKPKFPPSDETDAFASELGEAVRAVQGNTPSPLLDGRLARDALILGHRQTQSIVKRKAVKV